MKILAESYYKQDDMEVNKITLEICVSKMTPHEYLRSPNIEIGNYVHKR